MALTSIKLFDDNTEKMHSDTQRTIVCFGTPRGGTSMVAGAIIGLGVPMGQNLPANVEDPAFNADYTSQPYRDFVKTLPSIIAERNIEEDIWGWKYPLAARYLGEIARHLRNPRFVVVMRDPVPACLRVLRRSDQSPMVAVQRRVRMEARNIKLVESLKKPTLLVSYERAIRYPVEFLQELAEFLYLEMPDDASAILEFMKPGEYKLPPKQAKSVRTVE